MNQDIKGCTAAHSEQETEWLMCEAMAEHMRSEGMDASAEQVGRSISQNTPSKTPPMWFGGHCSDASSAPIARN